MSLDEEGHSWFLAQLKPNCANVAEKNLKRQGFKTFLPLEEGAWRRNGKYTTGVRPLFSGYIFVAFDATRGLWRSVNSTYGVARLVSFGGAPRAMPAEFVSQMMLRCDAQGKLLPTMALKAGDRVTLTNGPFENFVGQVEKVLPDQRVWVLMQIMGGQTRVAVAAHQLQVF